MIYIIIIISAIVSTLKHVYKLLTLMRHNLFHKDRQLYTHYSWTQSGVITYL